MRCMDQNALINRRPVISLKNTVGRCVSGLCMEFQDHESQAAWISQALRNGEVVKFIEKKFEKVVSTAVEKSVHWFKFSRP